MDNKIQQYELSEAIQRAINKRKIKALIFLTFRFDPGFFEEEVLPVFFDIPLSHHPKIRIVQLEDHLREYDNIVVYYDRGGLSPEARPAKLDYSRIGLKRSTGFFHPKNIFILVENKDEESEEVWDSLITVTMSANLTQAGWWENVESVYIDEVGSGDKCSYRRDLLELIKNVKKEDSTGEKHNAFEVIRKFIVYELAEYTWNRMEGRWLTRIFYGQTNFPEFLMDFIADSDKYNLEIISPYFDETESASTISNILQYVSPKEIRIFLPESDDGSFLCKEEYYNAIKLIPKTKWGKLPPNITSGDSSDKNVKSRFVHAKVYRFWSQTTYREIFLVGSVNLTNAAHQSISGGNFETAILVEPEVKGRLTWWLNPITDKENPSFKIEKDEVKNADDFITGLSIRFNWNDNSAEYYWEKLEDKKIEEAKFFFKDEILFRLCPITYDKWNRFNEGQAKKIKNILPVTSLINIKTPDNRTGIVLIREDGMAKKPSLLTNLTAEDILRYWSLLSPEQKESFLGPIIAMQFGVSEYAESFTKEQSPDSMFDKFAGIFHAFGKLREHVFNAISNGRNNEAVYRLFGEKYDSLPKLIEKVIEDDSIELVNKYVTLLCSLQLVRELGRRKESDEFKNFFKTDLKALKEKLKVIENIKSKFSFDSVDDRGKFFSWYEEMFALEISTEEDID